MPNSYVNDQSSNPYRNLQGAEATTSDAQPAQVQECLQRPVFYRGAALTDEPGQSAEAHMAVLGGESAASSEPTSAIKRVGQRVVRRLKRRREAAQKINFLVESMLKAGAVSRRPTLHEAKTVGAGVKNGKIQLANIHGPKPLDHPYWRSEKIDRDVKTCGDVMQLMYAAYLARRPSQERAMPFLDWCDSLGVTEICAILGSNSSLQDAFCDTVCHLDALTRQSHRVAIGEKLSQNGHRLDTKDLETLFSGKGVGIYVMSKSGELYVGKHIKGQIHHSSFLSGDAVMGAGEIVATAGKINWISGKSGHYKPGVDQLMDVLNQLAKQGYPVRTTKVRLFRAGLEGKPLRDADGRTKDPGSPVGAIPSSGESMPVYVIAWEYMSDPSVRKKYSMWGYGEKEQTGG